MRFICKQVYNPQISNGRDLWLDTCEQIVTEIVHPSKQLSRGFDKPVRVSRNGHVAEGMISASTFHGPGSIYAGSLNLKVFGGETHKILFRHQGTKVDTLKNHSWMPPPSKLGLDDQGVRDIAEFLKGS